MNPKHGQIVILTGAGISAESGIKTFRDGGGLWEEHRVEDVATPEAFDRNPQLVQNFYNERRSALLAPGLKPNPAHLALARLEKEYADRVTVVTQNIDNLHERAGSSKVIHMHGELLKCFCRYCKTVYEIHDDLSPEQICQTCSRAGGLRPDVVWFGEMPYQMNEIMRLLEQCGLFLSIGTSGNVYPAAGFVLTARQAGARSVEINLEKTSSYFDIHLLGKAGKVLPELMDRILSGDEI